MSMGSKIQQGSKGLGHDHRCSSPRWKIQFLPHHLHEALVAQPLNVKYNRLSFLGVELGFREVAVIPGIVSPPFEVPIHVDDPDVNRQVKLVELVYQLLDLNIGVGPVATPPVAKRKAWRQWLSSEDPGSIAHIKETSHS